MIRAPSTVGTSGCSSSGLTLGEERRTPRALERPPSGPPSPPATPSRAGGRASGPAPEIVVGMTGVARHRFNNELRYREDDHPNQTQFTPEYILDPVRSSLGSIELDPCTTEDNPVGADRFYCPPQDGASLPWNAETIFVNPPYSKARERWVEKCIEASRTGSKVILLMPAATDTRIFQKAFVSAGEVVFIKGRVKFGVLRPNRRQIAASHGSGLIGWNVSLKPCEHLGVIASLGSRNPFMT